MRAAVFATAMVQMWERGAGQEAISSDDLLIVVGLLSPISFQEASRLRTIFLSLGHLSLPSFAMSNTTEVFAFLCEYFDSNAQLVKKYRINYFADGKSKALTAALPVQGVGAVVIPHRRKGGSRKAG